MKVLWGMVISITIAFAQTKPNVIIFFTDDQGTLDTKAFGAEDLVTPEMDALAEKGLMFSQAYAHTVCCPSRSMLLTGRSNIRVGMNNWAGLVPVEDDDMNNLNADELTIARVLKNNGYRTALFGKWHLGVKQGHRPGNFGFDEFYGFLSGNIENYQYWFLGGPVYDLWRGNELVYEDSSQVGALFDDVYATPENLESSGEFFPDLLVREARRFIHENKDSPFFMYMSLNLPHFPVQYHQEHLDLYPDVPFPRNEYAASLTSQDEKIGFIMQTLDSLNLRENTLVIFMSDNGHAETGRSNINGWDWGAQGGGGYTGKWSGKKSTLFEGGIRVPFIASWPGRIPQNEVRHQIMGIEDIFPTILEAADIPLPTDRKIDGKSLWPVFNSALAPPAHEVLYRRWRNNWAVIRGDWKLYSDVLYSLAGDTPEQTDFTADEPETVTQLKTLYDAWNSDVTTADIGTPVEGIGCMDQNYAEFDAAAVISDQALCRTLSVRPGNRSSIKGITIDFKSISISWPGRHSLKIFNIKGEQIFTASHAGAMEYPLSVLKGPGLYHLHIKGAPGELGRKITVY